jgi:hypothetical protein
MRPSTPVQSGLVGLGFVGIAVLKYGVGVFPASWVLVDIANSWSSPGNAGALGPGTSYLLSNAWTAIGLGALGITTSGGYLAASLALTVVALLVPFVMPSISERPRRAGFLFVLLAASALPAVLLQWVGGYDALTVIATCFAVLGRRRWVGVLGWVLLGLNHTSLAAVAFAVWCVTTWALGPDRSRFRADVSWALGSVLAGGGLAWLLVGASGGSRLEWFQQMGFAAYAHGLGEAWPYILWSVLGIAWPLLVWMGARDHRAVLVVVALVTATALLVPLVALDETRVIALAVLPALLSLARHVSPPSRATVLAFGTLAVILPTMVVLGGSATAVGWWLEVTLPALG